MSAGLKGACVIVFVLVVLAGAFVVFRRRAAGQITAVRRGESPPVPSTAWDTGDVQDTTDAGGAHH